MLNFTHMILNGLVERRRWRACFRAHPIPSSWFGFPPRPIKLYFPPSLTNWCQTYRPWMKFLPPRNPVEVDGVVHSKGNHATLSYPLSFILSLWFLKTEFIKFSVYCILYISVYRQSSAYNSFQFEWNRVLLSRIIFLSIPRNTAFLTKGYPHEEMAALLFKLFPHCIVFYSTPLGKKRIWTQSTEIWPSDVL